MTIGLSPKAVLAFLFPLIAALGAAAANWIASGSFDAAEVRTSAAGLVASGLALLGAYLGHPGEVVAPTVGPASDAVLADQLDEADPGAG